MLIYVDEGTDDKINMDIEDEIKELYPWIILNINEIGDRIAYTFFDVEYEQISQKFLDDEINDYLSVIHERIIERAIQKLAENGVNVI
mgnify:FL=1